VTPLDKDNSGRTVFSFVLLPLIFLYLFLHQYLLSQLHFIRNKLPLSHLHTKVKQYLKMPATNTDLEIQPQAREEMVASVTAQQQVRRENPAIKNQRS
jgi:hypothetical protein